MSPLLSWPLRALLFSLGLAATLLPRRLELLLGPRLGRLALLLDPKRRGIALDNLRRCLPELEPDGRNRLLRENYEHYGLLALEILHMFSPVPGHYHGYVERVCRLEGFENWKRANEKGRGVILFSGHLANWELALAAGAMAGMPFTIVTRHLKPEWLHKKVERARFETGVRAAYLPRTLPAILKALRKGETVGFAIDQYAHPPEGIPARFFGTAVNTLGAVGVFAQRYGAAIVPVRAIRDLGGAVRVLLEPELELGDGLKDSGKTTQLLTGLIESWIRERPREWLWVHRRFKNLPAGGPLN